MDKFQDGSLKSDQSSDSSDAFEDALSGNEAVVGSVENAVDAELRPESYYRGLKRRIDQALGGDDEFEPYDEDGMDSYDPISAGTTKGGALMERVLDKLTNRRQLFASQCYVRESPRHFQGNPNYLELFNREVDQFLELRQPLLDGDPLVRSEVGSVQWTSDEKDTFFQALSRYSIHRLEAISEQLPGKTESQILAYYEHLRALVKQCRDLPDRRDRLVSMSEMPIAYEMGDEFIDFEESQAAILLQVVALKLNAANRKAVNKKFDVFDVSKDLIDFDRLDPKLPNETQTYLKDLVVAFIYKGLMNIAEKRLLCLSGTSLHRMRRRLVIDIEEADIDNEYRVLGNSHGPEARQSDRQTEPALENFIVDSEPESSTGSLKPLGYLEAVQKAIPVDDLKYCFESDSDDKPIEEEYEDRLIAAETRRLEEHDRLLSLQYEHVLLTSLAMDPENLDMNDEDLSEYYVIAKYYANELPIKLPVESSTNGTEMEVEQPGSGPTFEQDLQRYGYRYSETHAH